MTVIVDAKPKSGLFGLFIASRSIDAFELPIGVRTTIVQRCADGHCDTLWDGQLVRQFESPFDNFSCRCQRHLLDDNESFRELVFGDVLSQ